MSDNKKHEKGQDRRSTQDQIIKFQRVPAKDGFHKGEKDATYDSVPPPDKKPKK